MGYNKNTIREWLKIGNENGFCEYNPKEEMIKNMIKNNKMYCSKPIEIFKNGLSLGIFISASELERQSEKIFGDKLLQGSISMVCTGKKLYYKGYTFKYITKEEYNKRIE